MNDFDRRFLLGGLAGLAGASALSRVAAGGPLTPPSGAVAPTGRTLDEVEPRIPLNSTTAPGDSITQFVISNSGSYILTGNLSGVSGRYCVRITANDVVLDLCGFTLRGVPGTLDAINIATGVRNVTIRNGGISEFAGNAVYGLLASACSVADMRLYNNAGGNIRLGPYSKIERVNARFGSVGIIAGDRSHVSECQINETVNTGVQVGMNSIVERCVALGCTLVCIDAGNGSQVINCNGSSSSSSHGVRLAYGSTALGCLANGNALNGFEAVQRNQIDRCSALLNLGNGVHAGPEVRIERCIIDGNQLSGILADAGGYVVVRGCELTLNATGSAAAAAIRLDTGANVVDGNLIANNARGLSVTGARNMVSANRAYSNAGYDYSIAAGNSHGPIVTIAGVGDISATANSGHPQANFRY